MIGARQGYAMLGIFVAAMVKADICLEDIQSTIEEIHPNASRTTIKRLRSIKVKGKELKKRRSYWNPARDLKLLQAAHELQIDPNCLSNVTSEDIRRRCRFRCSASYVRRRMNQLGVNAYKPLRMKDPSESDRIMRLEFCKKAKKRIAKDPAFFDKCVWLDQKRFKYGRTVSKRKELARGRTTFIYRSKGSRKIYTRPNRNVEDNVQSLRVNAAVVPSAGYVLWEDYSKFNSEYFCLFLRKIKKDCPQAKVVLLDHHKVHTSKEVSLDAKRTGLEPMFTPKRSPY